MVTTRSFAISIVIREDIEDAKRSSTGVYYFVNAGISIHIKMVSVFVGTKFIVSLTLPGIPDNMAIRFPGLIKTSFIDPNFLEVENISWKPGEENMFNPYMNLHLLAIASGETTIKYTVQPDNFNPEFMSLEYKIRINECV